MGKVVAPECPGVTLGGFCVGESGVLGGEGLVEASVGLEEVASLSRVPCYFGFVCPY